MMENYNYSIIDYEYNHHSQSHHHYPHHPYPHIGSHFNYHHHNSSHLDPRGSNFIQQQHSPYPSLSHQYQSSHHRPSSLFNQANYHGLSHFDNNSSSGDNLPVPHSLHHHDCHPNRLSSTTPSSLDDLQQGLMNLSPPPLMIKSEPIDPPSEQLTPSATSSSSSSPTTTSGQAIQGKTRTRDKYRVVYSDNQRSELEKEFETSKYITIQRKAELSVNCKLTERQIKIWFQNRRAKERKMLKKRGKPISAYRPSSVVSSPDPMDRGSISYPGTPNKSLGYLQ